MPGLRRTVFNPEGEPFVPETERFAYQQQRDRMSDSFLREQLNAMLMNADADRRQQAALQGTFADKAALGREMEGTFADRSKMQMDIYGLQDRGLTERARIAQAPALEQLAFERERYGDTAPAVRAKAQGEADFLNLKNDMLRRVLAPLVAGGGAAAVAGGAVAGGAAAGGAPAAGAGAGAGDDDLQRAVLNGFLGINLPSKRERARADMEDQLLREDLARKRQAKALEAGDYTGGNAIATREGISKQFRSPAQLETDQALAPMLSQVLGRAKEIAGSMWFSGSNREQAVTELRGLMNSLAAAANQRGYRPEEVLAFIQSRLGNAIPDVAGPISGLFDIDSSEQALRRDLGLPVVYSR